MKRISIRVLTLWVIVVLSLLPFQSEAGTIKSKVNQDDPDFFAITIDGGKISGNGDQTHTLMGGAKWVIGGSIKEVDGNINDKLTVLGTARHIVAPHGEAPGKLFMYGDGSQEVQHQRRRLQHRLS